MTNEQTPLIRGQNTVNGSDLRERDFPGRERDGSRQTEHDGLRRSWLGKFSSLENQVFVVAFLITWAFEINQVSQLFTFHLMECDIYYDKHPLHPGQVRHCNHNEIAARTSTQFSVLTMSTTFFGVMNLFMVSWMVKTFGPRATVLVQIFVPAIRVSIQLCGVVLGKGLGEKIIQASQIVTIVGGPAGYRIVLNIIAGEVVTPEKRTATFGKLYGATLFAQGLGRLAGGILGDTISIRAPYICAIILFLSAVPLAHYGLPYISPETVSGKKGTGDGIAAFLAPLKVIVPRKLRLSDGKLIDHYGVTFLCSGIFFGVLATGYALILLQMFSTSVLEFTQWDNGWLMFEFSVARGIFLTFAFPMIISRGRSWFLSLDAARPKGTSQSSEPEGGDAGSEERQDVPDVVLTKPDPAKHEPGPRLYQFDLFFLRWSYLLDGLLTSMAAFITKGWHIHIVAFAIPLASGSAPAAKGVVTAMVPHSQRTDALNAITLVELIARLLTQCLFGIIFASLSSIGMAHLTFICNAAIALCAMGVLLFSHFPPLGSVLVSEDDEIEEGEPLLN